MLLNLLVMLGLAVVTLSQMLASDLNSIYTLVLAKGIWSVRLLLN